MLTGLVVGKFSPLHAGHQALIDFARARCDRLVLLSWSKPELPGCTADRRAAWLAALYPDTVRLVLDDEALALHARRLGEPPRHLPENDAPDAEQRAFAAWVCRTMLATPIDRIFTSEAYGDGFAAAMAQHSGRPMDHVSFDPMRRMVPISATRLRAETALQKRYLPDLVRRTLVRRVALIGGESTGKTTLAAALGEHLGTCWVPEYGRELWERRGGRLVRDDMVDIAREQIAREEQAVSDAAGWVVCDTTPLITAFYSEAMFGSIAPELARMAVRRYDLVLLCAPDFAFVQDGTRRDAAFRQQQDAWYRRALLRDGVAFRTLEGSLDHRMQAALLGASELSGG